MENYLRDAEEVMLLFCSFDFRDMYELIKHPRPNIVTKPEIQRETHLKVIRYYENYYGEFYECYPPEPLPEDNQYTYRTYSIPCDNCFITKHKNINNGK